MNNWRSYILKCIIYMTKVKIDAIEQLDWRTKKKKNEYPLFRKWPKNSLSDDLDSRNRVRNTWSNKAEVSTSAGFIVTRAPSRMLVSFYLFLSSLSTVPFSCALILILGYSQNQAHCNTAVALECRLIGYKWHLADLRHAYVDRFLLARLFSFACR